MKKTCMFLLLMLLAPSIPAESLQHNRKYSQLDYPITNGPQVLELFSFYCPHCYWFEKDVHLFEKIKKRLPKNTKIARYHVGFFGPLGGHLTHAWAVAMALGVEEKIIIPMYEVIQNNVSTQSIKDIRQVFVDIGIKSKDYDAAWDSFTVESLINKQRKIINRLQVHSVPNVFVDGKYQINQRSMDHSSMDTFSKQYIDTILCLIGDNQ